MKKKRLRIIKNYLFKVTSFILGIVTMVSIFFGCVMDDFGMSNETTEFPASKVKAPESASYFEDKNVEDVIQLLVKAGFEKIKMEGKGDLIIAVLHSNGDVIEVSIGGDTMFHKNDVFEKEEQVIVRYHSYKVEEYTMGDETTLGSQEDETAIITTGESQTITPPISTPQSNLEQEKIRNVNVGEVFQFGAYEQDNNADNGKEPIE